MKIVDTMANVAAAQRPARRQYSRQLKAQVVQECRQSGASVAGVALAIGRSNWPFAGSLRAGQRAAAIMSLIQSAKLNGHDPYAYLKDVLLRLPTHPARCIDELLPHRWQPARGTS